MSVRDDDPSASAAATPTSVWKWFVKVSAQRITLRPAGLCVPRCRYQARSVIGANSGSCRSGWTPAARFATGARKFATRGAFDATRAAWSISPNAYACRGRSRPS